MDHVDVIIAGAGAIGLACGYKFSQRKSVLVLDQHGQIGTETSSRNSEVIHAGLYYPTNSLKARLCVEGKHQLYEFCERFHVPHRAIGKLLVAVTDDEHTQLERIDRQAQHNGVQDLEPLSAAAVRHREPALVAVQGLFSPSTGIIDSHTYLHTLLGLIEQQGGMFVGHAKVVAVEEGAQGLEVTIKNADESETRLSCDNFINAAGLGAQALAQKTTGKKPPAHTPSLIPPLHLCRGHYFAFNGKSPFSHLIYPMPEAGGLGVHGTLDLAGQLKFGPDVQYIDRVEYAVPEHRKETFVRAIRRYWPTIDDTRLQPSYSGIRPKLHGPTEPQSDFVIQGPKEHGIQGLVHLFGIESPGLTSSLAIADHVMGILE